MMADRTHRTWILAGVAGVVTLQAALFAWNASDDSTPGPAERSQAQLLDLPETDAPLADRAEVIVPDPGEEAAPREADAPAVAALPAVPRLTVASANASQPLMFMETLDEPEAEENPAVSYASVSDFLVSADPNPRPLRPIDDRPVAVLAAIGGSRAGIGIGAGGPHCKPQRPSMFTRSAVVSGAPSVLRRVPGM